MSLDRSFLPAAAGVLLLCGASRAQSTQLVSLDSSGAQANHASTVPTASGDGRFVAFVSFASNLVPGDTNGQYDVFVRDRLNGTTERVSVDSAGAEANGPSGIGAGYFIVPGISADGRYVAFESGATNLVAGDTNSVNDVFRHDRQTGTTVRVSVDSAGVQGNHRSRRPSISDDGRYVAFLSEASNLVAADMNALTDTFVHDCLSGATECVSVNLFGTPGNWNSGESSPPAVSSDGRFVAFDSHASDLVSLDINGSQDMFVRDRLNGVTERVNLDPAGVASGPWNQGGSISDDGRFVAFASKAPNLVAGDTNYDWDVFVRDRLLGMTDRVSLSSSGIQTDEQDSYPSLLSISADGRFVAFNSLTTTLVGDDTNLVNDCFVRDRLFGTTERVSVASNGSQGGSSGAYISSNVAISGDGRYAVFMSGFTDLVAGDTNGYADVFVRDRGLLQGTAFCAGDGSAGACPCGNSGTAGRGCENSGPTGGAILTALGNPSLASDTLGFTSWGELPTALTVFLQGSSSISPSNFGDGLRCAGGALKRLYVYNAQGGVVRAPRAGDPSVSARSAMLGDTIVAGTTRYYQNYYRDPQLAFCPNPPGNSWNVSSGLSIVWDP